MLKKCKIEIDKIKINFEKLNIDFNNERLSWQYHIFAGLEEKENLNILEIGTHKGEFTNFLATNFKKSKIFSIDLSDEDPLFKNSYLRNDPIFLDKFLKSREKNLKNDNIKFLQMNSFDLLKKFEKNYFDVIWLDGDHINPQVCFDVISAFYLLKVDGILVTDDLYLDSKQKFSSISAGYEPIRYLTEIKKLKTNYFLKRVTKRNAIKKFKKFISYSIKLSD